MAELRRSNEDAGPAHIDPAHIDPAVGDTAPHLLPVDPDAPVREPEAPLPKATRGWLLGLAFAVAFWAAVVVVVLAIW